MHGNIAIVGNSGSGKSTLARLLSNTGAIPTLDLDTVAWEPGQIAVPRSDVLANADVNEFCRGNSEWIVEGCYARLVKVALAYQPHLLFLDPGLEQCADNCRSRPWEPHKYESKEEQDSKLEYLLAWIGDYYSRDDDMSLAAHTTLFAEYAGPKRRLESLPDPQLIAEL